jgi:hypothetical protein
MKSEVIDCEAPEVVLRDQRRAATRAFTESLR